MRGDMALKHVCLTLFVGLFAVLTSCFDCKFNIIVEAQAQDHFNVSDPNERADHGLSQACLTYQRNGGYISPRRRCIESKN